MIFKIFPSYNRQSTRFWSWRWLAVAVIFCHSALAQVEHNAHQLSFNHITSADGLPQNTISAMLQDQHGFLWIGTHDGLHRYDGYEFI